MLMNNNSKTLIWDNIPEWAIYSLIYGIEEDLFLTDDCLLYTSDAADE